MKKSYQYAIAFGLVLIIFFIIIYLIGYSFDLGHSTGYDNGYNNGFNDSINIAINNCVEYWCAEDNLDCTDERYYIVNEYECVKTIYNNKTLTLDYYLGIE